MEKEKRNLSDTELEELIERFNKITIPPRYPRGDTRNVFRYLAVLFQLLGDTYEDASKRAKQEMESMGLDEK